MTSRWTVIALVGCEIANDVPILLGGVRVGRLPAHMNFLMPQRGFQIECEGSMQIVNPQHLDINSKTVYWVERTASDPFEAMEAVRQEEDPIIRAVLSANRRTTRDDPGNLDLASSSLLPDRVRYPCNKLARPSGN